MTITIEQTLIGQLTLGRALALDDRRGHSTTAL